MLSSLIIPYAAITSRMAGGGLGAKYLPKFLPELLFALPFGYVTFQNNLWPVALASPVAAFIAHNTGHGTAFFMGERPQDAQSGRKQFLSRIVDPICELLSQPLGGIFYCWLFMGIKGLLIGLSLGLTQAVVFAMLWPLSYWIGRKWIKFDGSVEYLSGFAAGVVIYLSL